MELKRQLTHFKPQRIFLVFAIVLQCAYVLVTPPFQSPDEMNHFFRAFQVSEGVVIPVREDNRLGGYMPESFRAFAVPFFATTFMQNVKTGREDIAGSFDIPLDAERRVFCDFPNTCNYSPVSYLPQAAGMVLARMAGGSVGAIYYAGRLSVAAVWIFCMFVVIRMLPAFRWLFVMLSLLPMQLYIASSYNADTVNVILVFLSVVSILRLVIREVEWERRHFMIFILLGTGLALAKIIYVVVLGLLVMIPVRKFNSLGHKLVVMAAVFAISGIAAMAWSDLVFKNYISRNDYNEEYRAVTTLSQSDFHEQKAHLAAHPELVPRLVFNGLFHRPSFYLGSYVGHFGTYMDSPMPDFIWIATLLVLLLIAINETSGALSYLQKLTLLLTALAVYTALVVSHHLTWNALGSDIIDSIQGRYLFPIIPLVLMALPGVQGRIPVNTMFLVVPSVVVINFFALEILYTRYFRPCYNDVQRTVFAMEYIDTRGRIMSADRRYKIARVPSIARQHTGNASLRIETELLKIMDIGRMKAGDLLQIRCWKKGDGGQITIACEEPEAWESRPRYTDKDGWQMLDMHMTYQRDCDSVKMYLENKEKVPVYFDDVEVTVSRNR